MSEENTQTNDEQPADKGLNDANCYTEAPWSIRKKQDEWSIMSANNHSICEIWWKSEMEMNAAIIAASPLMYELTKKIDAWANHGETLNPTMIEIMAKSIMESIDHNLA